MNLLTGLMGLVFLAASAVFAVAQTPAPSAPSTAAPGVAAGGMVDYWWIVVVILVVAAVWYFMRGRSRV